MGILAGSGIISFIAEFATWLKGWQTLTSGILAVAAAGLGAAYLSKQTRASFAIHNDHISRRHNAAKLLMIPQLTQLSLSLSYVHSIVISLSNLSEEYIDDDDDFEDEVFKNTELKIEKIEETILNFHLKNLGNFTESLDSSEKVSHLIELLSQLNELNIILLGLKININKGPKFFDNDIASEVIISCSKCLFLINSISRYCRNKQTIFFPIKLDSESKEHWSRMTNYLKETFRKNRASYELEELIFEKMQESQDKNLSPWLTSEAQ